MSSNEIMLALSNEVERSERYEVPPGFTKAGQVERRHERKHVLAIRDVERCAREFVAASARDAVADIAWLQARAQVKTQAKFLLEQADKESRIIAGDDPLLKGKFDIIDDEFFMTTRSRVNRAQPEFEVGLFE